MGVRSLPAPLADAIAEPVVRPFWAVHIAFADPVHIWSGIGTLAFGGAEWTGFATRSADGEWGAIGAVEPIGETTDGSATGIRITLNGIPGDMRDHVADQGERGVLLAIYVGALNETMQIVESFKLLTKAALDSYRIEDAGPTLNVTVTAESRMIDQRRPAIRRYTDAYQQARFPGDRFFQYQAQMAEVGVLWAKAEQNSTSGGGGSPTVGGAFRGENVRLV